MWGKVGILSGNVCIRETKKESAEAAQTKNHAKFMAKGKSDTAVEGQEVRKDKKATQEWR